MTIRLPLSALLYPPECVQRSIAAYEHLCSIEITDARSTGCAIEVRTAQDVPSEDRLVHEFLNYLLDLSLEHYLSRVD